jgi:excisionase family DNA binding protein
MWPMPLRHGSFPENQQPTRIDPVRRLQMAKMFYSIDEAAEKLGVSTEQLNQMAAEGKLQQFRDRDKIMFKVDQVDAMAGGKSAEAGDTSSIPLADTSGGDALSLDDTGASDRSAAGRTGVSVFDADEVDLADPLAQTVMSSQSSGADLSVDSVGSGSGLLDLTRESDDTSLGADVFQEVNPSGSGQFKVETGAGLTGIFEGGGTEAGTEAAPASLTEIESAPAEAEAMTAPPASVAVEQDDPAASGWMGGLLLGSLVALILAMLVLTTSMTGVVASITRAFAGSLWMYAGGLAAVTIVLAVIGLFIGKAASR